MSLVSQIRLGIDYLLRNQAQDGGIPATRPGQSSGSWTTASTLNALICSRQFPREKDDQLRKMARYLLNTRIPQSGWPMSHTTTNASTMATGHSIAALSKAKSLFLSTSPEAAEIDNAAREAATWLASIQSPIDGGWGVDHSSLEGRESRVLSTIYALRGFIALGTGANAPEIARAVAFLTSLFNENGGCGSMKGAKSDVCSTARVVYVLIECQAHTPKSALIRKALQFLIDHRNEWVVLTEKFVAQGAPGMILYHGNSPYDVLHALLSAHGSFRQIKRAAQSYKMAQNAADGSWLLHDKNAIDTAISTWSTAEAIEILDRTWENFGAKIEDGRHFAIVTIGLVLFVVCLLVILKMQFLADIIVQLPIWWSSQSDVFRNVIVIGGIVGLVATLVGTMVTAGTNSLWRRWRNIRLHNRQDT